MDTSMIEATQALEFDDYEEELKDENETFAYLNVPSQKGFAGKLFPIKEGDNLIGRGENCSICIPLKGLSREHACIEVKGGNHFIYDKGSRNKTRRNNFFLATSVRYELKDKDALIFGDVNCTYQVGSEAGDDGDETGSETGSESMFETAPMGDSLTILETPAPPPRIKKGDSLTILETPAPPPRIKKGFADEFTIPESESDTDDENQKTVVTTLVADSQALDETTDKLMGAPTQAFVCDSDVTTDDDSPKKKSILLAATQGYEMDTESDDDAPHTHNLLTAATQAYIPDSDESPPKKTVTKQPETDPTMKYDMVEGIEPTLGYDMDGGGAQTANVQDDRSDGRGREGTRIMVAETQSFLGDDAEDADRSRLLCEATQAFHGAALDDDTTVEEEEASENSKLMAEPTQAFLGDKVDKGDNQSESSEEFVLEGDTDNENDDADLGNMFAAPTLACDADVVPSEDEGKDDKKVSHDDATQAITEDATQAVEDVSTGKVGEDQTVAIELEIDGKGTQAVHGHVTQRNLIDTTVKLTEDQTVAVASDTLAIYPDTNLKVNENSQTVMVDDQTVRVDQTVAVEGDTLAIIDGATVKVIADDQTVALTGDTLAIHDEPTVKVAECDQTVAVAGDTLAIHDEATMKIKEDDQTVAVADETLAIHDKATINATGDDQTVAVGDQTVAVADDTLAICDEATLKVNEDDKAAADAGGALDETIEKSTENRTTSIATPTDEVSETVIKHDDADESKAVGVSDTVSLEEDMSETEHTSDVMETVPVENIAEETDRTIQVKGDKTNNSKVTNEKKKGKRKAVIKKSNQSIESVAKDEDVHQSLNTTNKVVNDSKKVRGKRGGPNKQIEKVDDGSGDNGKNIINYEELENQTESTAHLGRGRRGKVAKDYDAMVNAGRASKRKSTKTEGLEQEQVASENKMSSTKQGSIQEQPETESNEDNPSGIDKEINGNKKTSRSRSKKTTVDGSQELPSETKEVKKVKQSKTDSSASEDLNQPIRGQRSKVKEPIGNKEKEPTTQSCRDEHLEPATQAYMETSPRKGNSADEPTQRYQDDDATPSLEEIDHDGGQTDLLVLPQPSYEALPSRSPLKSALVSPQKKKSPSPKRVQFVSQNSETGSENSQTSTRSRRSKQALNLNTNVNTVQESKKGRGKSRAKQDKPNTKTADSNISKTDKPSNEEQVKEEYDKDVVDVKVNKTLAAAKSNSRKGKGKKSNVSGTSDLSVSTNTSNGIVNIREETGDNLEATGTTSEFPENKTREIDQEENVSAAKNPSNKPKKGKVEQTKTSDETGEIVENKRKPREQKNSNDDTDSQTSDQSSQNSNRGSRNKRKTWSEPLVREEVGIDDVTNVRQTGRARRTTHGVNIEKVDKSESVPVEEPVTGRRGKLKHIDEKTELVEMDKQETRERRSKTGAQNAAGKTVEESEINGTNKPLSQLPVRGSKRKSEQAVDKQGEVADGSKTVQADSQSGDKGNSHEVIKQPARKGRSKQTKQSEAMDVQKEEEIKDKTAKAILTNTRISRSKQTKPSEALDVQEEEEVKDKSAIAAPTNTKKGRSKQTKPSEALEMEKEEEEVKDKSAKAAPTNTRKGRSKQTKPSEALDVQEEEEVKDKSAIAAPTNTKKGRSKQTKPSEALEVEKEEEIKDNTTKTAPTSKSTNRRAAKRKGPDDSTDDSNDPVKNEIPAKKLKVKETQSTPRSSTKLDVTTPKSSQKKETGQDTPKRKQLDATFTGSPTLRKTTTNGVKPKVIFTGVTDEQGAKIVKDLGGELPSSVMECTHLVTDQIRRTVKFLCCLARGIPIVSPQWLMSSKKSGFFTDTTPHIVRDDASEKKFKCILHRSIQKANDASLLTGYKIHVTKSVKPGPDQMKDILKCAGAQYLTTMPKTGSPTTVVISCDEDKSLCETAVRQGVTVVNAEFVLTGILRQEVDINSYLLFAESQDKTSSQEPPSKKRKR